MAQLILGYHQVMPEFMESVFSFGYREHGEDCALTSFQSHNFLTDSQSGLQVPELGRSLQTMQHCYGLRSVERSGSQPDWPWSIRLCSLYHSFDFESTQSVWIVIKANRLIEKLVRDEMMTKQRRSHSDETSLSESISKALQIHEMVAQWCGSDWQFYVKFLEGQLQDITRPALSVTMEPDEIGPYGFDHFTDEPETILTSQMSTGGSSLRREPTALRKMCTSLRTYPAKLPVLKEKFGSRSDTIRRPKMTVSRHQFSFKDLPRVHYIEEKANEAVDVLENNEEILQALKEEYSSVLPVPQSSTEWPEMELALDRFEKRISNIQINLRQQRVRLEKLLRLLRDRKTLVSEWNPAQHGMC